MDSTMMAGVLMVVVAGILVGGGGWPIKIMRKFQFEHWAFIAMLTGLIFGPWLVTLIFCPNLIEAYKSVDSAVLIKSNIFSLGWGIANVLCMICFVRIGFSLTGGILGGIGISLGVSLPMIFKGSGLFQNAPDIISAPGLIVLAGVAIMILAVILASLAGFGRDKILQKTQAASGNFMVGLIMAIVAGFLSSGISFSFVYSQGPIVEAMKAQGASEIPANFAVWAIGLCGGAMVNVLYPAWLMTRKRSWNVLTENPKEFFLAVVIGINTILGFALMGKGMLLLGALGASVGFGIQQSIQMLAGQAVGFIGGEWKGVHGKPRKLIYAAIFILLLAAVVMAWGNSLS